MALVLSATAARAGDRTIVMSTNPQPAIVAKPVRLICTASGDWRDRLTTARLSLYNPSGTRLLSSVSMTIANLTATYDYTLAATAPVGTWRFDCTVGDGEHTATKSATFLVSTTGTTGGSGGTSTVTGHQGITSYAGPSTCISCHTVAAQEMLGSLHMKWVGPTPEITNAGGKILGKAVGGVNTFCTYAMSSKGACFNCHVRADGNAPHAASANDVDCLMCHNDTYQRKFVSDPNSGLTVTNVLGQTKTYYFGLVEPDGDYVTTADFGLMPPGTTMVSIARTVHRPTRQSCLRCHAKAGGGDWVKRGDMGLSSVNPTVDEDFHMSSAGANLKCTACHRATGHKMGGRGIDLRETEAPKPVCSTCHGSAPHSSSVTNRHASGRVACQVCHIRTFGKGGATEMSRDWTVPTWSQPFCNGQGGFIGEERKLSNVLPEYVWFDGTSYVYNVGETITPDVTGIYRMAKANGRIFDGKSKIVPVKRHFSVMPLHSSGKIIPPAIMWMFMTGDFDQAVQKGMQDQGLTGSYTLVDVDAELLITHGVDPKSKAPACTSCHASSGNTVDGSLMLPFGKLGYHVWPAKVYGCTLCHSSQSSSFSSMHDNHRSRLRNCNNCHTAEPKALVKPTSDLCNDCHSSHSWQGASSHKEHVTRYDCTKCHVF